MNPRIPSKIIFFIVVLVFVLTSHQIFANADFWKIQNVNVSKNRVEEVAAALKKCQSGLKQYFEREPSTLTIYLYKTRSSFVQGLQDVHGFSKQSASYFKESSAPRPLHGKLLVPPDQNLQNICHEIVHHYLENNTSRENLLNAKWFDEGTASFLANILFSPKKSERMFRPFIEKSEGDFIPIDQMQSEEEWSQLHQQKKRRSVAYLQAMLMMDYFFHEYSVADFKQLLAQMRYHSFDKAFAAICKRSQKKFYRDWKKSCNYLK